MVDEQILIQRIKAGDQDAFRDIFERYRNQVYRFCLFVLGDEDLAKDIYQETFIAFYQACRQGTTPRNVRNYILTAARNRSINYLKSRAVYQPLQSIEPSRYEMATDEFEFRDQIQMALSQIPYQYRESFLLFELWGYSYEEIANQLQISLHTVKNRIYRARIALRKVLSPIQ